MAFSHSLNTCPWCERQVDEFDDLDAGRTVWSSGRLWHDDCLAEWEDGQLTDEGYDQMDGHA